MRAVLGGGGRTFSRERVGVRGSPLLRLPLASVVVAASVASHPQIDVRVGVNLEAFRGDGSPRSMVLRGVAPNRSIQREIASKSKVRQIVARGEDAHTGSPYHGPWSRRGNRMPRGGDVRSRNGSSRVTHSSGASMVYASGHSRSPESLQSPNPAVGATEDDVAWRPTPPVLLGVASHGKEHVLIITARRRCRAGPVPDRSRRLRSSDPSEAAGSVWC